MSTLRQKIIQYVKEYAKDLEKNIPPNKVPVSGKVFDEEELIYGVEAVLDGWWTEGKWNSEFEKNLRDFIGLRFGFTVNSGSSANLLAFYSLTSKKLGERRIKKGDEVISVAASFPTTINPIIQYGAIPVFVDIELGTYVPNPENIKKAITKKTKAIFLAHTLGNPFQAKEIREIADEHGIWLIEDNCDALGSTYNGKRTGSFGHLSTLSFYPAHHITTGEGGAVFTDDPLLNKIAYSFRNWGRDCWCPPGQDNTCGKRFKWKLGKLPFGYDHKYIYSECGFNLKMTDMQAAIGVAQMKKIDLFVKIRKENFEYLKKRFIEEGLDEHFIMPLPTQNSDPSWFGFPLTLKGNYNRTKLLEILDKNGVCTRLIFAGNIIKQPYFVNYEIPYKVIGNLNNTDQVMEKSFWIGVYPALKRDNLEYAVCEIKKALKSL